VAGTPPQLSPVNNMAAANMVDMRTLVPDIDQDIRYFGSHNFTGKPVEGYLAPRCYLQQQTAVALARVEMALRKQHQRLRLYDCYRPARAVAQFVRWMGDAGDLATQAEFYPGLEKALLRGVYIAPVSGHSRGGTVDLTLLQCDAHDADCKPLDMGTAFDFFGTRAHTDSTDVDATQHANRYTLGDAMRAQGFVNLPEEWWHFTLKPEPSPHVYFDVPVTAFPDAVPQPAIDKLMQRYAGEGPGASLLVLQDGKPLVARGYGRSDVSNGSAAGPLTAYRLASVSKQFTAAAILLLVQDGKVGLQDSVRTWFPGLPVEDAGITVQHLLTHASGLMDYEDLMATPYTGQIHDAGVLALLEKEHRLYFKPGTGYRYSNGAYALLALLVEKASGKTFPDFLKQRIFKPLGMTGTLAYVQGGPEIAHRAFGYSLVDGQWQRTDQSSTSAVLGDGGIYSSIDDLARWDAALYDNRLLTEASRKLAFSPHNEVTGEGYLAHYGFGWRITGDTLWHSGETIGFRNVIVRWPKQHLTVVLLSNRNDPEPYQTALAIGALFVRE
jgi:CubicO group peptidase (beta-lactamase class C family)